MPPVNPEQFVALYTRYEQKLYRYVAALLTRPDDAEDVLQDTARVLWQKFDQYRPDEPFLPWACAIAHYEALKNIQETPLKPFRKWQAFSQQLRQRDDLLAYYDFQRDADDPHGENGCQIMRNRAKTGPEFDGRVWGTLRAWPKDAFRASTRFPGKHAVTMTNVFHGKLRRRDTDAAIDQPEQYPDQRRPSDVGRRNLSTLIGEKYLCPTYYFTGEDGGDNENWCSGFDVDTSRFTAGTPRQDLESYIDNKIFGSAHATGFHMAFCDGSVQQMSYSIEADVHKNLGNRKDGYAIDAKKL